MKKHPVQDFFEFIRFRLCILAPVLALSGYFMHNNIFQISIDASFLVLGSFFLCTAAYAYNNITDKKEDVFNRKKITPLVSGRNGKISIAFFFLAGLFFSLFLPAYSFISAAAFLIVGTAYSFFRIKKYLLIKNVYTGFSLPLIFLMGAFTHPAAYETFSYYVLISVFLLIGSMISDLRDYAGDRAAGVRTLPVCLGYEKARGIIMLLLAAYSASLLLSKVLLVFLPFVFLMFLAIKKDEPSLAHSFGKVPFIFLMIWLAAIN